MMHPNTTLQPPLAFDVSTTFTIKTSDVAAQPLMRLVPHKVYDELVILWPILWLVILPLGLVANGLNIRTFFRMGLGESVTISFFVLALSDFAQLLVPLANVAVMFMLYAEKKFSVYFRVQPLALFIYVVNVAALFNTLTSLITAFLAVQRCLCIALPFHFRGMFTKTRTWCVMASFTVYSAAPAVAYLFVTYELRPMPVASPAFNNKNRTQLALGLTDRYVYVQKYADILIFTTTSIVCLLLNLGSLVVMAFALAASVRFRRDATTMTGVRTGQTNNSAMMDSGNEAGGETVTLEKQTSTKERTAIVQVALLSSIYLVTSLPKIGFSIGSVSNPEFQNNGALNNLFIFLIFLRVTFDYLNSAVNFFIYYKYNTQFRKLCFANPSKKRQTLS